MTFNKNRSVVCFSEHFNLGDKRHTIKKILKEISEDMPEIVKKINNLYSSIIYCCRSLFGPRD